MRLALAVLLAAIAMSAPSSAQGFTQRGFAEGQGLFYPQTAPNDTRQLGANALVRYEPAYTPASWVTFAGSFDARIDTFGYVERAWRLDWLDQTRLRPAFSVRRLTGTVSRGGLAVDLGRQFIRWGKADIINPTDRFAPRDYMDVVVTDFLAVAGARVTYERKGRSIDLVWVPFFTPSRLPVAGGRWSFAQPETGFVPTLKGETDYPKGSQYGVRWNHAMSGFEYSVSFYDGFDHVPLLDARATSDPLAVSIVQVYPKIRMYGADAAWPLRWFTLKGEAGYFTSPDPREDEYGLYVVQAERQVGEWFFVGGYSGQVVTKQRAAFTFAPDRGLTNSFLGRASLTIDVNRSVAFQAVVRDNGNGVWIEAEYSQAHGQHLRFTLRGDLIRGTDTDFLGHYHRNSHLTATLRYSF